jgi:cobalt-zinc-cadmium efflux system membrane fusion protein
MSIRIYAFAVGCALAALAACSQSESEHAGHAHGAAPAAASAEYERGPHRGRWLADGDFAVELTIFEDGVPPEFRAYLFRDGKAIEPAQAELAVTLTRLGNRVDRIGFAVRGDYLLGDQTVYEPHSFDAEVVAREGGREHRFAYSSYENRVTLAPEQIASAGIELSLAGPAAIRERVALHGRIAPNGDALAHVMPRFAGIVRSVHKRLGDTVAQGDLLARIESNESLQVYELRAQLPGTVIARDVSAGEFVSPERELFRIADLASVWVDLDVYRRDFGRLRAGQVVRVDAGDGSPAVETTLAYLSPVGSANTQTLLARAVLPNPDLSWRPGLFVSAEVEIAAHEVPVAVAQDALQRVRDWDVVFLAENGVFEAQPIELGRRDATQVEVLSGLFPGQRYVSAGSFMLKAEAGKSGATHDH